MTTKRTHRKVSPAKVWAEKIHDQATAIKKLSHDYLNSPVFGWDSEVDDILTGARLLMKIADEMATAYAEKLAEEEQL